MVFVTEEENNYVLNRTIGSRTRRRQKRCIETLGESERKRENLISCWLKLNEFIKGFKNKI